MSSAKAGLDLSPLRDRIAWADEYPTVLGAPNGDQNAITLPHAEMDGYLRVLRGPEWDYLRELRWSPSASGCISREYPGIWVRAALSALEKEKE